MTENEKEGLIQIEFIPREKQLSEYDWFNISVSDIRVGKARCKIGDNEMTIYSINIYPEYEGKGYGKRFVDFAKEKFNTVIADRVRNTAIGFWEKMGFLPDGSGNWVYRK